jgi:hypothetical protein
MSTLSTIDNQMAATGERLFAEGMAVWHRRFDEQVGLIEQRTDTGIYHPIRESFGYARALVQAEGESAIPQAERILRRALQHRNATLPTRIMAASNGWMKTAASPISMLCSLCSSRFCRS